VKPHISHIHIKDGHWNPSKNDCDYTNPGEGAGQVRRIMADVVHSGYAGFVSIEPHVSVVFHSTGAPADMDPEAKAREQYDSYVAYGKSLEKLLSEIGSADA
jgi:sugar phosphate isomerase/epimerase